MKAKDEAIRAQSELIDNLKILIKAVEDKAINDREALERLRIIGGKAQRVYDIIERN